MYLIILYRIRTKFYYHVYVVKPKTLLDKVTADMRAEGVRGDGIPPNTFIYCDICEKKICTLHNVVGDRTSIQCVYTYRTTRAKFNIEIRV